MTKKLFSAALIFSLLTLAACGTAPEPENTVSPETTSATSAPAATTEPVQSEGSTLPCSRIR